MTLYRETPCKKHGHMRAHHSGEDSGKEYVAHETMIYCPGGSREEVVIDYQAALREAREGLGLNIYEGEVRGIIDAALHTEKEPASTA